EGLGASAARFGSEIGVLPLRAKRRPDGDHDGRNSRDERKRQAIVAAVLACEPGLEWAVARSDEIAELVGEAGEERPRCWWRKLVQVDRNDAPGSLNGYLYEECADAEHYRRR